MGFLVGWLAPFVLLTATFNPTGVSFVAWARDAWREATPIIVLVVLGMGMCWGVFWRRISGQIEVDDEGDI